MESENTRESTTIMLDTRTAINKNIKASMGEIPEDYLQRMQGVLLGICKDVFQFCEKYNLDEDDFFVTIIANLEKRKGIVYALEAMKRINNPRIKLEEDVWKDIP